MKVQDFKIKVQSHEVHDWGWSVLVGGHWMDVSIDHPDIDIEWNQYIFDLTNSKDVARREFQDDCDNYDVYSSLAVQYLEQNNLVYQDYRARWYIAPQNIQDRICLKEGDIITWNDSVGGYNAHEGAKARVVRDFHRKDEYVVIEWIDNIANGQNNGNYYINMFNY